MAKHKSSIARRLLHTTLKNAGAGDLKLRGELCGEEGLEVCVRGAGRDVADKQAGALLPRRLLPSLLAPRRGCRRSRGGRSWLQLWTTMYGSLKMAGLAVS